MDNETDTEAQTGTTESTEADEHTDDATKAGAQTEADESQSTSTADGVVKKLQKRRITPVLRGTH
ncbi:hypothetical protein [Lactobacillus thailandensis]|uniref:Uncharacterized protein n=1 Tax=Lacticaseibacillus thailandensis DSM 22698 = JCM 13996 TaxID=1423810 RepID=A0A0R2C8K7_9LACO|nr:hypothetical protein FD19_GL001137 [Lacticaseibacillus thailandensis DSM 22698 = JCM 13996]